MIYCVWRAGRVIAGLAFARRSAGRKVRTPWSSRFTLGTKVLARRAVTKVFGGRRLRLKGNAPGNARGLTLRAVRANGERFSATDSATENKPPVQRRSAAIGRHTLTKPA